MSAVGSILAGWLGDKIGAFKTLKLILFGWVITLPILALSTNFLVVAIVSPIMGLLIGSVWTVTRAYLTTVFSKEHMGYGFSFYTIMERFASIVGPLTWGGIIWFMHSEPVAYRVAAGSMTVFIIIGLLILYKWKRVT
jgi:MFS transporter, UMF1 family